MSKADEKLREVIIEVVSKNVRRKLGTSMIGLNFAIKQIRDAGFIHKSEVELDEEKIYQLIMSGFKWYSQIPSGMKDLAKTIAQAKKKIIK